MRRAWVERAATMAIVLATAAVVHFLENSAPHSAVSLALAMHNEYFHDDACVCWVWLWCDCV
jgi:hypothetical protein